MVISHGFTVNSLRFAGALWGCCRLNRGPVRRWGRHLGAHLALLGFALDHHAGLARDRRLGFASPADQDGADRGTIEQSQCLPEIVPVAVVRVHPPEG